MLFHLIPQPPGQSVTHTPRYRKQRLRGAERSCAVGGWSTQGPAPGSGVNVQTTVAGPRVQIDPRPMAARPGGQLPPLSEADLSRSRTMTRGRQPHRRGRDESLSASSLILTGDQPGEAQCVPAPITHPLPVSPPAPPSRQPPLRPPREPPALCSAAMWRGPPQCQSRHRVPRLFSIYFHGPQG